MNLKDIKHIHFTGIKGVGMTSLALCAQDLGIKISGSDVEEIFVTDEILKERNILWQKNFCPENIDPKTDLLITTGAHGGLTNPEVIFAQSKGIPVITHAEGLKLFAQGKDTLAVCGVGGKTTVSAMLANLLTEAGQNPSYAVGVGKIFPLGMPGKYLPNSQTFICEADEFAVSPGVNDAPRFSYLDPKIIVVTNIEHDHPDIYPTIEDTKKVFLKFFDKLPSDGLLVACNDNPNVKELIEKTKAPIVTYGFDTTSDWVITDLGIQEGLSTFKLKNSNEEEYYFKLKVYGDYNLRNSVASFLVALHLGVEPQKAMLATQSFEGSQRRFEKVGKAKGGFLVYDDYAHHPKEIISVLGAIKKLYPEKRIIAVFQPHTYSRTKSLFSEFALSFGSSDLIGIMDIYSSAREKKDEAVSSALLAEEIGKYHPKAFYTGDHKKTLEWISKNIDKDDLVITMGAGDIFYINKELLNL